MLNNIDINLIDGIAMTISVPKVLSNASNYDTQIAMPYIKFPRSKRTVHHPLHSKQAAQHKTRG